MCHKTAVIVDRGERGRLSGGLVMVSSAAKEQLISEELGCNDLQDTTCMLSLGAIS